MFIRGEIKRLMAFFLGPESEIQRVIARELLAANPWDSAWQRAEPATPQVKRMRRAAFRGAPVADLSPRLAAPDFPSLALRRKSLSASRLVSVKQMALRTAQARLRVQRTLEVPAWQLDRPALAFSLPIPRPSIPSRG